MYRCDIIIINIIIINIIMINISIINLVRRDVSVALLLPLRLVLPLRGCARLVLALKIHFF